ncbi:MAG: prolipoprotein diacylglyceryl transferase, partial [Epsilonproteobacteria bacterium]
NFMNSEIVGNKTDVPWAIVFSRVDEFARHPAQLYEALSYLLIFFILTAMYLIPKKPLGSGVIFGTFLTLVFTARITIEFVKVPQAAYAHETFLSTGQMLSIPFLFIGIALIFFGMRKSKKESSER